METRLILGFLLFLVIGVLMGLNISKFIYESKIDELRNKIIELKTKLQINNDKN